MKRGLFLIVMMLISLASMAQFDNEFWFAPPYANPVHDPNNTFRFVISTSTLPSTVTITQPANPSFTPLNYTIAANSNQIVTIPNSFANVAQSNNISNRGFKIVATEKVFCYYEIYTNPSLSVFNTEIFALKGKNALGTNFLIPMQNYLPNHTYTAQCYNFFSVIATEDNTNVTIIPTQPIDGHSANIPFSITLNTGQFYTARAVSFSASGHPAGSSVMSNKNVAITYYDDSMSGVPFGGCADTGGDQIIPINLLGTWYVAVQGFSYHNSNNSGSVPPYDPVFVLAVQDNTEITINGTVVTTINAGETYKYQFTTNPLINSPNSAAFIQTNYPVYVSQVSGFACELGYSILPPVKCRGSRSVSVTRSQGDSYYLTLMTNDVNISSFTVNGAPGIINASDFQAVPGTFGLYMFARKLLTTTQFPVGSTIRIENSSGDFQMGVINGGTGNTCKFGFFSDFAQYPVLSESVTNDTVCEGDTIHFLVTNTLPGSSYTWTYLETGDIIQGPGGLSEMIVPNANITNTGTYLIEGSYGGCEMVADTLRVYVMDKPIADFAFEPNCAHNPTIFQNSTQNGTSYLWDFGDGNTSTITDPSHIYESEGSYSVSLIAYNHFGCSDTISYQVDVNPGIEIFDTVYVCPNSSFIFYGNELSLNGDYEHFIDADGCDSTIYLHLEKIEAEVTIQQEPNDFCEYQTAQLIASSDFPNYLWSTGETGPHIVVTTPGLYSVTASNSDCSVSTIHKILPCEQSIYLPNTITPGKKDGSNDFFCLPEQLVDQVVEFEIMIFNRWGNQVYYSRDPAFKWNGKPYGTNDFNQVYTYRMIVRFDKSKAKMIVGSVIVL